MSHIIRAIIGATCLVIILTASASEDPYREDRALFLEAYKALNERRLTDYKQLSGKLTDYPLYPYLQYRELRDRISRASNKELAAFIKNNEGDPLGRRMQQAWLYKLARKRDWPQYLEVFHGRQPVELQCYRLQAQIKTEQTETLVEDALKLWLIGESQDKACDPVFKYLDDKNKITTDLLWQRIRLAMEKGNPSLAGYLARRLSDSDRSWVALWRKARGRPARTLESPELKKDSLHAREIILYSVRRISRTDADQAYARWETLKPRYEFTSEAVGQLERNMAMSAIWQKNPRAHEWLVAVPDEAADIKVREWRIRTALALENWDAVLVHTSNLPIDDAHEPEWRYWQSVALEKTDQRLPAMDSFARLAKERDYHGFLAADYLRWPYEMGNHPLEYDPAAVTTLSKGAGFLRAHELLKAELFIDARREWEYAIRNLSNDDLKLAAVLANQWGWHDRAILTVARAKDYSDLKLRFPLDYQEEVQQVASNNRLDTAHVYAVIRQESAFNKDARSPAGAMGLMQLMPRTGRVTASKNNILLTSTRMLFEPGKNISIGSAYLRKVMDEYGRNIVLASAAYNAGPHRVKRWLPENKKLGAANWIALIPYTETRKYVQRILAYMAIYDWRMKRTVTPLKKHMPLVMPVNAYSTKGNDI
jgi:soluble lytic murein transglycosylase